MIFSSNLRSNWSFFISFEISYILSIHIPRQTSSILHNRSSWSFGMVVFTLFLPPYKKCSVIPLSIFGRPTPSRRVTTRVHESEKDRKTKLEKSKNRKTEVLPIVSGSVVKTQVHSFFPLFHWSQYRKLVLLFSKESFRNMKEDRVTSLNSADWWDRRSLRRLYS